MNYLQSIILSAFMVMGGLTATSQRIYQIERSDSVVKIDGIPSEPVWENGLVADNFTTRFPIFGEPSRFKSEVKMCYDDNALYVSAELHDPSPDSVSYSMSQRDESGNADWFAITIDPYGNGVNGFSFAVTSAGVEIDALEYTSGTDYSWNAVWKSAVAKREFGWSLEMKIPFSAIRFPNKKIQEWNVNFYRDVRRVRENSNWNPIDPSVFGEITQSGKMTGIENVKSPVRLSFTPYATGYLENSYDATLDKQVWKQRVTGGLDLKYGLNDAFTLDMTVIPDFGQTTSDRQVLNLGPFEVRYAENRPFFIEGTDLFQIGGVFYSRRIGASPYYSEEIKQSVNEDLGEEVVSNPSTAPMINGTKVSGRTKGGLGIGVFNTIEGRTDGIIQDTLGNRRSFRTNPLTNYNVFVLSQNLKNNSTVSFVNTNVTREGGSRDANVSVATTDLFTEDGKYKLSSSFKLSSIFENEYTFGHAFWASVGKVSGTWQYRFSYNQESDTYDPNDLGFLYNNNSIEYDSEVSWNSFESSTNFFRRSVGLSWHYEQLYSPQLFAYNSLNWFLGGLHKKQVYMRLSGSVHPFGEVAHFESRSFGKEVKYGPSASVSYFFTTDYSKRFALDGSFWGKKFWDRDMHAFGVYLSPRIRVSDRMEVVWESNVDFIENDYGYVSISDDSYSDQVLLGNRARRVVENSLNTQFVFTKRMGIDLRLRHYWQQVIYNKFFTLLDEGAMRDSDYFPVSDDGKSTHNTSYNAFTLDINYRWIFYPGSELRIVYKNNIFSSKSELDADYFTTFSYLFDEPQVNSLSLKVLFYIDALYFKKGHRTKI